ncbi:hypothetical protein HanXRQr2_Chr14g0653311 [Helianthus annuus]|uniref:Uncharacterized protein n=1 Tax=Helianthus annuus TaxID=4232 RepID=A0A9K3EAD2_HELAN|nr:hypothetical protein HanXRQr2_Chr14g0653311 [Helianthus annuus]
MLVKGPKVYQTLQNPGTFKVTREPLRNGWRGEVFCRHCKGTDHFLHFIER